MPTRVCIVEAMVFPVVRHRCESWTVKKAECWRIDAFELWCWGRLLRVPWTARRSNQSILRKSVLNIHWKDWSWSSNTLATWCEELSHWKRSWCWERLKAGREGDDREWDSWMASRHDGREFEQIPGVYDGQGSLGCCSPWGRKDWVSELNWTDCLDVKKNKTKCRYIQWIYSVEVFSCILFCSTFIYEIEVYEQMCPDGHRSLYMNKISSDKCYKVHRNTVGRAELFFAECFQFTSVA